MQIELVKIGADTEVRFTPSGDAVANIRAVYNYGKKVDRKQPSQWIDATLWGKRAESLAPYLTKGAQVVLYLEDVHIDSFQSNGETKSKLAGRVVDVKLVSSGAQNQTPQSKPAPQKDDSFFDDSDSIPF